MEQNQQNSLFHATQNCLVNKKKRKLKKAKNRGWAIVFKFDPFVATWERGRLRKKPNDPNYGLIYEILRFEKSKQSYLPCIAHYKGPSGRKARECSRHGRPSHIDWS